MVLLTTFPFCPVHHVASVRPVGRIPTSCLECKSLSARAPEAERGRAARARCIRLSLRAAPRSRVSGPAPRPSTAPAAPPHSDARGCPSQRASLPLLPRWGKGNVEKVRESEVLSASETVLTQPSIIQTALSPQVSESLGLLALEPFEDAAVRVGLILPSFVYCA